MNTARKITYFLTVVVALVIVYSVAFYLGTTQADRKIGGSLDATIVKTCTYTSVSVSSTRKQALEAFGGRQYIRLENSTTSAAGATSDVFYRLTNTSTTVSTSTGSRIRAGGVEEFYPSKVSWPGQIWLLSDNAAPALIQVTECY